MIKVAAILMIGLGLGACVPTAPPYHLVAPADPYVGVRGPAYSAVTGGVKRYQVVDPKDWRELNREVTPQAGQGGGHEGHGTDSAAAARRSR